MTQRVACMQVNSRDWSALVLGKAIEAAGSKGNEQAGPDKVGKQASAACRHRPQFVVLLIVNFVGTDPIKDICL